MSDNVTEDLLLKIKDLETKNNCLAAINEELSKDLLHHHLIINSASDLIHSVTPEGRFLYTNKAWRDTLGYTEQDLQQLTLMDIVEPKCKEECAIIFQDLIEGKKIDRNATTLMAKNGACILVEGRCATHFANGQPQFMTGIFRDMTKQTSVELALLESEKKYKELFENSSNLIQLIKPDGNFLYVNRAWRDTFGYSEEEVQTLSIFDLIAADCREHCQTTFQRIISEPELQYLDAVFTTKTGQRICIEGNAICKFEEGKPISTQCIFNNVTEKKKMEEELMKVRQLESLGVLAGGIAHDFNNLLTAILGNISMAKMYTDPENVIAEYLEKTETASIRAQGLTKQLLTFSKGGAPIKKVTTISELIKDATTFILRGSKAKCEYNFAKDLWAVEADKGQLSQVSQNLVLNASQAMPDGGTITIKAANKILTANEYSSLPPGNYIELLFQDTGTGIAQKDITRIFDPYFTSKSTGSGLGLAICYSIIKNHNGLITVNSELGKGSVFSILLPATIKPVRKIKKLEVLQKTAAKKILVMDDDQTVQEILRAMLTFIGCSVELASDGKEALALYMQAKNAEAPFDLVIMDLTIPGGMGGKETMAALLALDPTAKAVVSSGYANDLIMANFQQYGFGGILTKPFKIDELNKVIAAILPAAD